MKLKSAEFNQQLPSTECTLKCIDILDNALSGMSIRDTDDLEAVRNGVQSVIKTFGGSVRKNLSVKPTVIECDITNDIIDSKGNFIVFVQEPMIIETEGNVLWK